MGQNLVRLGLFQLASANFFVNTSTSKLLNILELLDASSFGVLWLDTYFPVLFIIKMFLSTFHLIFNWLVFLSWLAIVITFLPSPLHLRFSEMHCFSRLPIRSKRVSLVMNSALFCTLLRHFWGPRKYFQTFPYLCWIPEPSGVEFFAEMLLQIISLHILTYILNIVYICL